MKELKDEQWLLLVKAVKNEITEKERDAFHSWLASDRNNQDIYRKMKTDWEQSSSIQVADHPTPDLVWNKIAENIHTNDKKGKLIAINQSWVKYAAAVAILILGSVWLIPKITNYDYQTFEGTAQNSRITLSDGSEIWLDRGATLAYQNFDDEALREVTLTGKAYFEIARDETKPFLIHIGKAQVEVLGTAFNINGKRQDKIIVDVTHGKVSFGDNQNRIILTKDKSGVLDLSSNTLTSSATSDLNFLSWKTGILVFDDTRLSEVCRVLKDQYDEPISISADLSQDIRLTATFDNQTLAEVAEVIALTLDLEVIKTEKGLKFEQEPTPTNKLKLSH